MASAWAPHDAFNLQYHLMKKSSCRRSRPVAQPSMVWKDPAFIVEATERAGSGKMLES